MNILTETEIYKELKERMDEIEKIYNNVLGVFTIGKANYGYAETLNDLFIIGYYIPDFEELCSIPKTFEVNSKTKLLDIRLLTEVKERNELTETLFSKYYLVNEKFKSIFDKNINHNSLDYGNFTINSDIIIRDNNYVDFKKIVVGIQEMIKLSMINVDKDKFLENLTQNEIQALDIILKRLNNGEGNLSISQIVNESNISRPVFKNILQKLKDNNIAEINNMGVKGTYIKLYDTTLFNNCQLIK